jgi:nitrite reductase (NADH) small subunit
MAEFVKVCKLSDIPPGSGRTVDVKGKPVAVFNVDGALHAISDTCLHRGGPLGEGELEGTTVICPWHGWRYDVTTGANDMNPSLVLERYQVKVEGDDVLIEAK